MADVHLRGTSGGVSAEPPKLTDRDGTARVRLIIASHVRLFRDTFVARLASVKRFSVIPAGIRPESCGNCLMA
jgi:hypothetical protein